MENYVCSVCGYIYNQKRGDEAGGIPAGLAFVDIPMDWQCPVCGADKSYFAPAENAASAGTGGAKTGRGASAPAANAGSSAEGVRRSLENAAKAPSKASAAPSAVSAKKSAPKDSALKERARAHLEGIILPYWNKLADFDLGGFYGYVGHDLKVDKLAEKGVILHSRILWFYSTAYLLLGDEQCKRMATHAFAFLNNNCFDREFGGLYWMMNHDGTPSDKTKNAYNQAFGIYGMAAYYKATGNRQALRRAYELFECIETYCTDSFGYLEAFGENWKQSVESAICDQGVVAEKTMNTLLHVLEAYTLLFEVDRHPLVAAKLAHILELFRDKLYYADLQRLEVFFDAQMKPLGDIHSYGHDIEASWLLDRACDALDAVGAMPELAAQTREYTSVIARKILACAFDGSSLNNEARGERSGKPRIDTDRIWWVQAETVVGFFNEYQKSGERKFLEAAQSELDYIEAKQVDKRAGGEWFWYLDAGGTPKSDHGVTEPWKCPYHNGRMCLELMGRNA